MTSEESSFLTALVADAFDYTTRLVYADWLGDHERYADELRQRGVVEGLIAMRVLGRKAVEGPTADGGRQWRWWDENSESLPTGTDDLPRDWLILISRSDATHWEEKTYTIFPTLTDALEACALAFSRLPPERKAELLASADSAIPHFTEAIN